MKKINLGILKQWQSRLATYVSMIQFIMIFYIFITSNNWFNWYTWVLIVSILIVFTIWFDVKIVMESQLEYSFLKNPEWIKHVERQKKILKLLDKK